MSEKENKQAEEGVKAPAPAALQKQVDKLSSQKEKLENDLKSFKEKSASTVDALKAKVSAQAEEIAQLKAELENSSNATQKKNSGIPAVLKFRGKRYTREEVLTNPNLQKELAKVGFFKQSKNK